MRKRVVIYALVIAVLATSASVSLFALNQNESADAYSDYGPEYASPQMEALIGVENYRTKFVHNHPPITCTEMPFCSEVWWHRFDTQLEKFIPWPEGEPTPEPTPADRIRPTLAPTTPTPHPPS